MSATNFPQPTSSVGVRSCKLFSALMEMFAVWAERARGRRRLMMLDDRALADIGISRAEAEAEWEKPPWRR